MKTTEPYHTIIGSYFDLLNSLYPDGRLELISHLPDSMRKTKKEKNGSWKDLLGVFASEKNADELIREIEITRTFSR